MAPEPVRRFALEMPNAGNTRQGDGMVAVISSDGSTIITRAGAGTDHMLYSRAIGDFEPKPLEGTTGGSNPVISPDDRWIAFLGGTALYKVRAGGGARTEIGTVGGAPAGLDWADDGRIYSSWQGKIWRIPADGGDQEPLTGPELEEARLSYPHVLAGSKVLLCSTAPAPDRAGRLHALNLETFELKDLDMVGTDPHYLPTGHVLFAQSNRAFVAAFDVDRLEFTGPPFAVHPRAWVDQNQLQVDVSDNGTTVYLPRAEGAGQALVSVGLDGKQEALLPGGLPFQNFNDLRISRDGRQFLVTVEDGIYLIDLDTQTPTLMTDAGFYPLWSPDGSEIVFSTSRAESYDVYRRPVDLSRPEEILLDEDNNLRTMDWTRQGILVIREEIPGKGMDLRYHETIDTPEGTPLLTGDEDELAPVVSADGKWLAYVSDYSGTDEIYVTSFPTAGGRLKVSLKGGTSPTWAPDTSALYYFEGRRLVAVSVETEPRFRITGREVLFEGDYVQYRWSRQYDIHPDGKRFIMVKNPARGNLEVVTNWFAELRELKD